MVRNNDINLSFFQDLNTVMQEKFAEQDTMLLVKQSLWTFCNRYRSRN